MIGENPGRDSGAARQASMLTFTAAASNGVPSWNVMPSRSVNVHCVKSAFGSAFSTRCGTVSDLSFGRNRGSVIELMTT